MWASAVELWVAGGFVMPFLFACAGMLWYGLGWRLLTLHRGDRRPLSALLAAARSGEGLTTRGIIAPAVAQLVQRGVGPHTHRSVLEELLGPFRATLLEHRVLVITIVAIAPLAGLLGTVTGMVETFRSLGEMALFTQGGGIAGGIGEALLTTQMGLAVSVPGVVVGRALDRRQARLEDELDRLVELVRTEVAP